MYRRVQTCQIIATYEDSVSIFFLLRWGWVFLERTRILCGMQFTTHFIEFLVVEMKRFVSSFANVILTR